MLKDLNADEVRKAADDWDFSEEGRRVRQAKKNGRICTKIKSMKDIM